MGAHHESRYKDGVKLGELPIFQNAPNKKRQRIIARQMFRNMTEQEIDEIVEIARMGISFDDLQVALTGKAVVRPADSEATEDESDEDIDGDEGLQEDAGEQVAVSAECAEQGHVSPDAGFDADDELKVQAEDELEVQADAEDGLVDSWESQEDVNPSSEKKEGVKRHFQSSNELEYLEMREAEADREIREWEHLSRLQELKGDLSVYNAKPRRVNANQYGTFPKHADILPETKP